MRISSSTRAIDRVRPRGAGKRENDGSAGRRHKHRALWLMLALAGLGALGFSQAALAGNPTYEIVGPNEWDLPIVKTTTSFFFQSGIGQVSNRAWNDNGNKQGIPTTHLIAGISRVGQLFSLKAFPNTGFFWEVLVPEISVYGHGTSVSGIGDPLLDFSFYWKPTPNSTVGIQNILSTTFGSNELSDHFWEYMPSFIWDVNVGKWGLDGTLGAGFPSDRNSGGMVTNVGNMYIGQFSLSYKATSFVEPFVNVNYQKNKASFNKTTGEPAAGLAPVFACAGPGGCHETVAGGGLKFTWSAARTLSVWYTLGVDGQNTVRTNAVYLVFKQIL